MCSKLNAKSQIEVDLPKKFYSKKVLFTVQIKLWFDSEVAENFLHGL